MDKHWIHPLANSLDNSGPKKLLHKTGRLFSVNVALYPVEVKSRKPANITWCTRNLGDETYFDNDDLQKKIKNDDVSSGS